LLKDYEELEEKKDVVPNQKISLPYVKLPIAKKRISLISTNFQDACIDYLNKKENEKSNENYSKFKKTLLLIIAIMILFLLRHKIKSGLLFILNFIINKVLGY